MKYTQVHISFLNEIPKELKAYLIEVGSFLECMLNFNRFESFVLKGNYTNGENEMGLSNGQIFDLLKEHDWHLKFKYRSPEVSGNKPMTEIDGIITVRDFVKDYSLSKSSAILIHEYGHVLGLDHASGEDPFSSFSFYLQDEGERLFREYEGKVSEPQKGKILIERRRGFPLCFLKKLEWR